LYLCWVVYNVEIVIYIDAGGPASGKGTQCDLLVKTFKNFVHLSAGELLRQEMKKNSNVGQLIDLHIKEGTIVPGKFMEPC
jgi:adenylate kinase family enzyme